MIDGNIAMNSHFENMSEKDMNDMHDHFTNQQTEQPIPVDFEKWAEAEALKDYAATTYKKPLGKTMWMLPPPTPSRAGEISPVLFRLDVAFIKNKLEADKADYLERAEAEGISKNDDFEAGFMACIRRMNGILNVRAKEIPLTPAREVKEERKCDCCGTMNTPDDDGIYRECSNCMNEFEPVKDTPVEQKDPEEIRCSQCGSTNTPDKDGVFRKECWHCKEFLVEAGPHSAFYIKVSSATAEEPAHVPGSKTECTCICGPTDTNPNCAWPMCYMPEQETIPDPKGEIPETPAEYISRSTAEQEMPEETMKWIRECENQFDLGGPEQYGCRIGLVAMYRKMQERIEFCLNEARNGHATMTEILNIRETTIRTFAQQREERDEALITFRKEIVTLTAKLDTVQQAKQGLIDDLKAKSDEAGEYRKSLEDIKERNQYKGQDGGIHYGRGAETAMEILAKYPNT